MKTKRQANRRGAIWIASLILALGSFNTLAFEPTPSPGYWYNYTGELDADEIVLSFNLSDDQKIVGSYSLVSTQSPDISRVHFSGTLVDSVLSLTENSSPQMPKSDSATIAGFFFLDEKGFDVFKGYRKSPGAKELGALNLNLKNYAPGNAGKRFLDFHGTDAELEAYIDAFKSAILRDDKAWLAEQLVYPMEHVYLKGKKTPLNNEAEFIARFNDIFHAQFRAKLAGLSAHELFPTNGGVSIGRGILRFYSTDFFPDRSVNPARYFLYEINSE